MRKAKTGQRCSLVPVILPCDVLQDAIRMLRAGDESTVIREDEDPIPAHEVTNRGFSRLQCSSTQQGIRRTPLEQFGGGRDDSQPSSPRFERYPLLRFNERCRLPRRAVDTAVAYWRSVHVITSWRPLRPEFQNPMARLML